MVSIFFFLKWFKALHSILLLDLSQMDRASILGDAIDYLKELLQRINDLHNELESTPPGSLLPPSTSFHPLTPTPPTLPCRVKEELFPGSLPSPKNQPARVYFIDLDASLSFLMHIKFGTLSLLVLLLYFDL